MDTEQLQWLGDQVGKLVVGYVDHPECAREFVDELSSDPKLKRQDVRINFVLFLAWAAMLKACELIGDRDAAQLFTNQMCTTVYYEIGRVKKMDPLLRDRWAIYANCGLESGPEGLEQLAKAFDACCGDTIADPNKTRTYSLDPVRHVKIAAEFGAFFSGFPKQFLSFVEKCQR